MKLKELLAEHTQVKLDCPGDDAPIWLVDDVFALGSTGGIGGPEKSLKSSVATELAVCLAAREPTRFLDCFNVCEDGFPVYYLRYEGTDWEFRDCVRRIEAARGIRADREWLHVLQRFPPLDDDEGKSKLEQIVECGEGLVIVDCLYAAFRDADWTRSAEIGGHLSDIQEICEDNESAFLFVHHFNKTNATGLGAFSGAGVKEHVGQWLTLKRSGSYDSNTGRQRFKMEIGSRGGFGGRYTLEVTEGRPSDPGGRRWETTVTPQAKTPVTAEKETGGDNKLADAVLAAIVSQPDITHGRLRKELKRSGTDIGQAVAPLVSAGKVAKTPVKVRGNDTWSYRALDGELT